MNRVEKLEYSRQILNEIFQLTEDFSFQSAADSAFNNYLKQLRWEQAGYKIVAVPTTHDESGKIIVDKQKLDKFIEF